MDNEPGQNCRSGCRTKDHETFGECFRAADVQIDRHGLAGHRHLERDKDRRLGRYADARSQGLQPRDTSWGAIQSAFEKGGVDKTPVQKAA
jgi:hypothetical protein